MPLLARLTPTELRRAEAHLASADSVMAQLIARHGPCRLGARKAASPFETLVGSIISQQLSTKAAATIKGRVAALVGTPFQPASFLATRAGELRAAGLSGAKARYIRELAEKVAAGAFSFETVAELDDEAAIAALTELSGIGRWTAEMFLLFHHRRADVLALGDGGLQRAAHLLYARGRKRRNLLARVGEPWRPYRSVASWYLWRSLHNDAD
ncbi:MAG: DNA-3-methyladenine glycosylase 2 family protein [Verrucomicrobiota bacterium]